MVGGKENDRMYARRNKAKPVVMQPKYASSTIKPTKGKGSYDRSRDDDRQIDWVDEWDESSGWIEHNSGGLAER